MRSIRNIIRTLYSRAEKPLYKSGILPTTGMTLPDFLGIGAMKSGSTWLYENLRCHPEIYLPDQKELYYFSLNYNSGSLRHYATRFQPGAEKVKGEITPGYSIMPLNRIRFIKRIMPSAKLIFIARDPVYRSWSEGYMNLIVKPNNNIQDVSDEMFIQYFTSGDCPRRSNYVEILDRWLSVFPSTQLFLTTLDEIQEQPKKILTLLFRYLNVSTNVDWTSFPFNRVFVPVYESNRMVYRGEIAGQRESSDTQMPESVREFLRDMYASQIEEFGRKYGVHVERWQ